MTPENLPTGLDIKKARLPLAYEAAKTALANCSSLDECKDWSDKAAALASYARQADDETLEKQAMRIKARAIRRCGELLKTFQSPGARTDKPGAGGDRLAVRLWHGYSDVVMKDCTFVTTGQGTLVETRTGVKMLRCLDWPVRKRFAER